MSLAAFGDRIDFREAFLVSVQHMADRRLTERTRERDVLRVIEVLIAKEHDFPLAQRRPDFFRGLRRQRLLEIDTEELGAREDGHRPNREPCLRCVLGECRNHDGSLAVWRLKSLSVVYSDRFTRLLLVCY